MAGTSAYHHRVMVACLDTLLLPHSTRGKRIERALEEEDAADNDFWNQDFFQEEHQDEEYVESSDGVDVVDSDFDDPVREPRRDLTSYSSLGRTEAVCPHDTHLDPSQQGV